MLFLYEEVCNYDSDEHSCDDVCGSVDTDHNSPQSHWYAHQPKGDGEVDSMFLFVFDASKS